MSQLFKKLILVGSLSLASAGALAIDLEVDPAHSSVGFDIKHLVVSNVHGNFNELSGSINMDEKKFENSKVSFKVKIDSINTNNAKRDGHLKSPDFFDSQKFPEATFTSSSIKSKGKDTYVLEGDLTIHGVTKKVKLDMVSLGKVKDPFGTERRMYHASMDIVRKDFGLSYNAKLETGGVLIGETAKLTIDVEAIEKAPEKQK